ncbi:Vacuolar protein sorting-associated protein 27 [Phytophthora citrophthora]|uniref:Vacuolar protein sorting-associated protein 27 n=1 Tax=Phytophthora citrophthora TaxID=4793 RepID=A0AAD9GVR0_9STRA|nr:Vacuolar protein sorting-associated protein 27 [Phytophthora citrophthora]
MKPKGPNDTKTALELAESSEWSALDRLVTAERERAEDMDDFGMMPLHWACTDTHVPLRVVKKLVDVAPSALSHKNKGGLLPLHIAVKAATKLEVLRALVQAAPDVATCLFEETPTGETPTELARAYQLTDDKINFLVEMEQQLRAEGKAPDRPSARFQAFLNQPGGFSLPSDDTASVSSFRSLPTALGSGRGGSALDDEWASNRTAVNAVSSALRLPDGLAGVPLPPRWRLDKRCNICQLKFSYFKTRHHCRSCGESVCSTHSNKRLPLHHLGLKTPQRVCILCYDDLRENGAPSAVVNMYGHGRNSGLPPMEPNMMRQESTPLSGKAGGRPPLRSINSTVSLTNTSSSSRDSAFQSPSDADRYFHTAHTPRRIVLGDRSSTDNNDGSDPTLTSDLPFEEDSRARPRAWTDVDSTEKYQDMQEQVRELESHVHDLTLAKSRIEKKLEDATRLASDAKKERNAVDANVAELRNNRIIDINRISFDDDEENDENQNNGNEKAPDFTQSFMQGRHRQFSVQVEKKIELIEDKEVNVAETCNYLGQVFLDRGEYSSAVTEFRKSVDADRKDVDVWINLARALHGAGEFYDAEIAIRRALALTPKNYASLSMLGKILHSKGEHDKAVEVFREALNLMDQEDDSDEDVGSMTVGW